MVTVRYGPDVLARQLGFGSATSHAAVPAGPQIVRFTAPGEHTATPVTMAAGSEHTIVVLDDSSGLKRRVLPGCAARRNTADAAGGPGRRLLVHARLHSIVRMSLRPCRVILSDENTCSDACSPGFTSGWGFSCRHHCGVRVVRAPWRRDAAGS